jgi:tripartite-type tricarboxylate transporter receptor subunit TctC
VAHVIGEKMAVRMGQPFIVENRSGAAGNLAAGVAAKAPPTGYSLFVASSANTVSPYLYKSLQYDPLKDFVYISRWITTSYMVVVNASHAARSLDDLIGMAKKNAGNITLGTQGAGKPPHLAGEFLSKRAGIRVLQVPFKGGPETMTALLSGVVDFTFAAAACACWQ